MRHHITPARLAAGSTAVVFVAAFTISWESLRVLAVAAGIDALLAPLFPLTIDALMVTGTVAAVALRAAELRTRAYTWALITTGIAVSVLGNAAHSQARGGVLMLPWWAAAGASAVPALSLAASLHLLVIVLRHGRPAEEASEETVSTLAAETRKEPPKETMRAPLERTAKDPRRKAVRRRPAASSRRRIDRLLARQPTMTAGEAAKRLGVSRSYAGKLLAEMRRPRVMGEAR